ncbi:uncharacterized protein LOC118645030 [Monomorium pharaonis]|uniref:uncharacterized protein LOC118645030 n=1 Tax=Monomorium pharaonis TaxID=307658 RepID=UPI0017464F41|nr:uncharacterized protein LOC118645030 [Monomorium pharaonis]
MFVKNMAIAVFGTTVLRSSSVTGTQSNRIKNKSKKEPRPKLDPAKLLAVRDALRYWLNNEKGYDEVAIEFEVQQVGTHISHKIYELNRTKKLINNYDVAEGSSDNNDNIAEPDVLVYRDHEYLIERNETNEILLDDNNFEAI